MKKDEILRVRLSKALKDKLIKVSEQRDISYSELIRGFIRRLKEVE